MDLPTIQAGWDQAAKEDAFYNILTDPSKANGGWDQALFFEHGQREIDAAIHRLEQQGHRHGNSRALDFGCGVGRLTQALAHHYRRVDGVDISPEMVRLAKQYDQTGQCTYHVNAKAPLPFKASMFDLVYSMIVLQHMPNVLAEGYIREFLRVLKPKGAVMFEVSTGHEYQHASPWLSMYGIPGKTVEQWIGDAGGRVVDMELIDTATQGYRYIATHA